MWRESKHCANCGELRRLHDTQGRCRYEQPGWRDIRIPPAPQPDLGRVVLARRGKEVFPAMRKETPRVPGPGLEVIWVHLTRGTDGQDMNVIVSGITHWRGLKRPSEGKREHIFEANRPERRVTFEKRIS